MILASFSAIAKSYQGNVILGDASGAIKDGDRLALLGVNGSGKTTLLDILALKTDFDSGILEIPNSVRIGYLPQIIEIDGRRSLFDYALAGLQYLIDIKNRIEQLHLEIEKDHENENLVKEFGRLQEQFEHSDGYNMENRAAEILTGLGFDKKEFSQDVLTLSGGQRNRAALSQVLISRPNLLLLDEPSNHLDITGIEYLESYLYGFEGGVIYVSHDRRFIQTTATTIWEMINGRIMTYPGNYENYLVERERRVETINKTYIAQKEFIRKTEDFIRRNIAGQKTKQAQSRRKMLQKLERVEKSTEEDSITKIQFSPSDSSTRIVVKFENAGFSYDDDALLNGMNFEIERNEKIGLVGPNGSGKTTLAKLIIGELSPSRGSALMGKKLAIGYYDQLTENLNQDSTPLATIYDMRPEWNEGQVRSFLARFLFRGEDVFRRIDTFSGGEQSRLALACLIVKAPNFLVLDEPTNHLDIQSREALEAALAEYEGTVLCISHDRYFLDNFAEKILALEKYAVRLFSGNYSYYREKKSVEIQAVPPIEKKATTESEGKLKTEPILAKKEKRINPQIIEKLDNEIMNLESNLEQIELKLTQMESSSDWQAISSLLNERDNYYEALDSLYKRREQLYKT